MNIKIFVIIVAGGKGLRMGATQKKQYLSLNNIPILTRTVMKFDCCSNVSEIILVVPPEDKIYCKKYIIDPFGFKKSVYLTHGGQTRQDSVFNGLKLVDRMAESSEQTIVMIHDGVRPFIDESIINDCIHTAVEFGACIPAVKITDTVKLADTKACIQKTVKRDDLYSAQTPQTFKLDLILGAFDHALETNFSGTDDASLMEHSGHKVYIVKGSKYNIKITTPDDLVLGKYLLSES
jgi:2-C-methyl-D-erythritol 4-phosphate cytidylyltransferase